MKFIDKEERDGDIVVRLDKGFDVVKVRYSKDEFSEETPYFENGEMHMLEEWKRNLVKQYGVDLNELRN